MGRGRPRKNPAPKLTTENIIAKKIEETTAEEKTEDKVLNKVKFKTGTQEQYNKVVKEEQPEPIVEYRISSIETTPISKGRTHVVQRGESIQSIAGLYSIPVVKLITLNGTNVVSVGQVLKID